MNNNELVQGFISNCLSCEKDIENTWNMIVLCDFKGGMNYINKIFTRLEEIVLYADLLNKSYECEIIIEELFQKLNLLEKAMQIPDYVLIADLIKYEIEELIIKWKQHIYRKFDLYLN